MAIRSRAIQDRRNLSRIIVRLDCQFVHEGKIYEAVMVDLSLKGAYLSSDFLPPNKSTITVRVKSPETSKLLVLDGTVVRGTWVMSEHGKRGRFGIRFSFGSVDLISLMRTMAS